jgi:hypothetical protein
VVSVATPAQGLLPQTVESFVLGAYASNTSLSVSVEFKAPSHYKSGGLAPTAYTVEVSPSGDCDPSSDGYKFVELSNVAEQQLISLSFRSLTVTRGGSWTFVCGGHESPALAYDISEEALQVQLNIAMGVRNKETPAVLVTKETHIYGARWYVEFRGITGDVGECMVEDKNLIGDDARMSVETILDGNADIVPGAYTTEIKVLRTTAFSPISGSFVVEFYGYVTDPMDSQIDYRGMLAKLTSLKTIQVLKV